MDTKQRKHNGENIKQRILQKGESTKQRIIQNGESYKTKKQNEEVSESIKVKIKSVKTANPTKQ